MNIKDIMSYDSKTGIAIRLIDEGSRGKKGAEVGKVISLEGKKIYKHRAIWLYMTGSLPTEQIIFIDGNKNNYKWDNLKLKPHTRVTKKRKLVEYRYTPELEIKCNCCGIWKKGDIEFFEHRKDSKLGYRAVCKECNSKKKKEYNESHRGQYTKKNNSLLRSYGISLDEYNDLLDKQDGKCRICKTSNPNGLKNQKFFAVDHNHTTGEVRGLLCNNCNAAIGLFEENEETLYSAIEYLKETNGKVS